jgi:hypothetical protein
MSGDPGVMFHEQHARIMEAGAHLDAEINRRLDAKGGIVKRVKQLEADQRDYTKWRKEAEKAEQDAAFEAIAKWLVEKHGFDRDLMTAERARERYLAFEKERRKPVNRQKHIADGADISDAYESRFNAAEAVGIDLQGLYDKSYDARMREHRGAEDLRAARAVLDEERRKLAYDVLAEIRPFADEGDLDFIEDTDHLSGVPWEDGAYSTYNAKYIAGPKLRRAEVFLPLAWIRSSNDHPRRLVPGWAARGHYDHHLTTGPVAGYSGIIGSPSPESAGLPDGVGTMVHELVHRAEHTRDGITGAEWTFYASRVSPYLNARWEDLKPLNEITGRSSYKEHERAREDHFVKVYSGKSYGDDMDSSYEILSMGVEDLVTGEHGIISQDEEYRHFVFGSLALL